MKYKAISSLSEIYTSIGSNLDVKLVIDYLNGAYGKFRTNVINDSLGQLQYRLSNMLYSGEEEDADEALRMLLSTMDFLSSKEKPSEKFTGKQRNIRKCLICEHELMSDIEDFCEIPLHIDSVPNGSHQSFTRLVRKYTEAEAFDGLNCIFCSLKSSLTEFFEMDRIVNRWKDCQPSLLPSVYFPFFQKYFKFLHVLKSCTPFDPESKVMKASCTQSTYDWDEICKLLPSLKLYRRTTSQLRRAVPIKWPRILKLRSVNARFNIFGNVQKGFSTGIVPTPTLQIEEGVNYILKSMIVHMGDVYGGHYVTLRRWDTQSALPPPRSHFFSYITGINSKYVKHNDDSDDNTIPSHSGQLYDRLAIPFSPSISMSIKYAAANPKNINAAWPNYTFSSFNTIHKDKKINPLPYEPQWYLINDRSVSDLGNGGIPPHIGCQFYLAFYERACDEIESI